jgi:hypothetical protein
MAIAATSACRAACFVGRLGWLAWASLAWMCTEGAIGLWQGLAAGSAALTGRALGIGRAVAAAFAKEGADVARSAAGSHRGRLFDGRGLALARTLRDDFWCLSGARVCNTCMGCEPSANSGR